MAKTSEDKARETARKVAENRLGLNQASIEPSELGSSNHTFFVKNDFVVKIEKNEEWMKNMVREPVILELLEDGKNIKTPELVEIGGVEGLHYRVTEFVEGENIDKHSSGRNFHNFDEAEKENYAWRIGEALAEVHEAQSFDKFGIIETHEDGIEIKADTWAEGIIELQSWWHDKLKEEGFEEIAESAEQALRDHSDKLNQNKESRLLHMEFDLRNLLFQENDLTILDWEVAAAGDPMLDLVNTEKRLIWRENEQDSVKNAFRDGYRSVRNIEISPELEKLYELFQMTRFLLIFRKEDEMRERIENRLNELLDSL